MRGDTNFEDSDSIGTPVIFYYVTMARALGNKAGDPCFDE